MNDDISPGIAFDFNKTFLTLTGNSPFPWQQALYKRFSDREIPASCSLPTGLGKASVVAIWLIALANFPSHVPRRLVYVVNRRTVVDQTTNEVERYRTALQSESLSAVREQLTKLCTLPIGARDNVPASPLALSTLRGQFADNREWSADPTRPAVIVGTVDMIGSRLLFSGYGIGFKGKPLHAGFLGQDVLLVHDEAHLEPAFQTLLTSIEKEQKRCNELGAFRVMELSATSRVADVNEVTKPFELTALEVQVPEVVPDPPMQPVHHVWRRLKARKGIRFHPATRNEVAKQIGDLARLRKESGKAILIFVRTVKDVEAVREVLSNKKNGVSTDRVQVLTGTLRGLERDAMTDPRKESGCPIFARFLVPPKADAVESERWKITPMTGTVYLVCTSAGEVGVDLSADHMVCDFTPLDSMAQRLGRVNRRGGGMSEVDVVYETDPDPKPKLPGYERARWDTKKILERLPDCDWSESDEQPRKEASPFELRKLFLSDEPEKLQQLAAERRAAFSPPPTILSATDILFDAWALTSIRETMPGRPDVGPYLHGIAEDLPQTTISWRAEMDLLAVDENPRRYLQAIFIKHRIRPHETVTINSYRVIEFFNSIAKKCDNLRTTRVALLFSRQLVLTTVGDLIDNKGAPLNADPTLILPASFGYLNDKGMLDANAIPAEPLDVADHSGYESVLDSDPRARVIIKRTEEGWIAVPLIPGTVIATLPDGARTTSTKLVNALCGDRYRVRLVLPIEFDKDDEDKVVSSLVLLTPLRQRQPQVEQPLDEHVNQVFEWAKVFAEKLKLDEPFREALLFAAKWHDEGKKAKFWQRYIGNPNYDAPLLGKSAKWCDPKKLSFYRHEFGSLLRIEYPARHQTQCVLPTDPDTRDLALHLIAAHHGHARPHFRHSFDKEFTVHECEATHVETISRFARLQRRYGRWGLAYFESLLRAADFAASAGIETDDEMEDLDGENV